MPPKTNTNPTKLAAILTHFHKTGVAHSLRDLEKSLPALASIPSLQVKDYLQALSDDSKIRVEKIGSGNWYWAFAGDERKAREVELGRVEEERGRVEGVVGELRRKVEEAEWERGDGDAVCGGGAAGGEGGSVVGSGGRDEVMGRVEGLQREVEALKAEVGGFAGADPVVLGRKREEVEGLRGRAALWTEHVWAMDGYLRDVLGMGREELGALRREVYGVEFDEEEGGLADI